MTHISADTSAAQGMASHAMARRALLGMIPLAAVPFGIGGFARSAFAQSAEGATATIQRFNDALLATMKNGQSGFAARYQALAPEIEQAFDLPAVLAVSVGPSWASMPPDQRSQLLNAFRRYTVASYLANFNSYNGQSFTVSPDMQSLPGGQMVVQTRFVPADGGDATQLNYVMKQTAAGWKVVDVLAAGSISRVAVQRSDFRHILSSGGSGALLASLQRKTSDLSGGSLA